MGKVYKGRRLGPKETLPGVEVLVVDDNGVARLLEHHVYHSPTGFEWGYLGSGPADLARSILWDTLGKEPDRTIYMRFKSHFVAGWGNEWQITEEEIVNWLESEDEAEFAGA